MDLAHLPAITPLHIAALSAIVVLLLSPVGRTLRRFFYKRLGLKAQWREHLRKEVPLYNRLPLTLKRKLEMSTNIFLREVRMKGKNGFLVTEKEKVTVAAHACMLLLGRRLCCYNRIRQVLIYPSGIDAKSVTEPGTKSQLPKMLGGLWKSDGTIRLSWQSVAHGAAIPFDGENVVLHEFAHELDSLQGCSGGLNSEPGGVFSFLRTWLFRRELKKLRRAKSPADSIIDEYGTTNQAELFACATEGFFERPADLKRKHPAIYNRLQKVYRLDPASW